MSPRQYQDDAYTRQRDILAIKCLAGPRERKLFLLSFQIHILELSSVAMASALSTETASGIYPEKMESGNS